MTETILVIDDQANVRSLLRDYLSSQGYRVVTANDGQMGLFESRHEHPNLVLLDLMMPKMDGYQFLSAFRKESKVPVIIITARDEETDTVLGLELGADDYVVKPFRMRELTARIRAALRRNNSAPETKEYLRNGELTLDQNSRMVTERGRQITLTPIEFDLLASFMRNPGRVFSRLELVDMLSDSGFAGLETTLNVHIRNLRLKIEPDPAKPQYVETVFGVGYRMRKEAAV